jgi:hypothetical protein
MTAVAIRELKSHLWQRDSFDHYVEEQWCSSRLFEQEKIAAPGDIILDPACGWGRILVAAKAAGYRTIGSDVINRHPKSCDEFQKFNFLHSGPVASTWFRRAKALISNPPFDQLEEFWRRAMDYKFETVAMIFPARRLPAARPWLEGAHSRVLYMTPRPSMPTAEHIARGGKVGGGKQDFCWVIARRGEVGAPTHGWLRRDA